MVQSEGARTLESDSGALAVVATRSAIDSDPRLELRLGSGDAGYRCVAFLLTEDRTEAKALLRFCDVVGVPETPGDEAVETPSGLVSCGRVEARDATISRPSIALFKGQPIDRLRLMKDAPIEVEGFEDLDAREEWFKKRHEGGD